MELSPTPSSSQSKSNSRHAPAAAASTAESKIDLVPESFSEAQRHELIAESAYFLAERRGFEPGHEAEDWLTAEALVADRTRAMAS
jgi:hypothetical protein